MAGLLGVLGGGSRGGATVAPLDLRGTFNQIEPLVDRDVIRNRRQNERGVINPFGQLGFTNVFSETPNRSGGTFTSKRRANVITPSSLSQSLLQGPSTRALDFFSASPFSPSSFTGASIQTRPLPFFSGIGTGIQPRQMNLEFNVPEVQTDFSDAAERAEMATFRRIRDRLQPQFDRDLDRERERLTNIGLPMGSEARSEALSDIRRDQLDTLSNAALDAVLAGQRRQESEFGQSLGANRQAFGQRLGTRGQALAEALAAAESGQTAQSLGFGQDLARSQLGFQGAGAFSDLARTLGGLESGFFRDRLAGAGTVGSLLPSSPQLRFDASVTPSALDLATTQQLLAQQAANQDRQARSRGLGGLFSLGGQLLGGPFGGLLGGSIFGG